MIEQFSTFAPYPFLSPDSSGGGGGSWIRNGVNRLSEQDRRVEEARRIGEQQRKISTASNSTQGQESEWIREKREQLELGQRSLEQLNARGVLNEIREFTGVGEMLTQRDHGYISAVTLLHEYAVNEIVICEGTYRSTSYHGDPRSEGMGYVGGASIKQSALSAQGKAYDWISIKGTKNGVGLSQSYYDTSFTTVNLHSWEILSRMPQPPIFDRRRNPDPRAFFGGSFQSEGYSDLFLPAIDGANAYSEEELKSSIVNFIFALQKNGLEWKRNEAEAGYKAKISSPKFFEGQKDMGHTASPYKSPLNSLFHDKLPIPIPGDRYALVLEELGLKNKGFFGKLFG